MTKAYRRLVGMAVIAAAAAIGLAACGGSSPAHDASVATNSGSASTTTTPPKKRAGNGGGGSTTTPPTGPTKLVDEWATCERSHGDTSQADPTIDPHGVINITTPRPPDPSRLYHQRRAPQAPVGDPHGLTGTCSSYLAAAQRELRAAHPVRDPQGVGQTAYLKYVACMRANGSPITRLPSRTIRPRPISSAPV